MAAAAVNRKRDTLFTGYTTFFIRLDSPLHDDGGDDGDTFTLGITIYYFSKDQSPIDFHLSFPMSDFLDSSTHEILTPFYDFFAANPTQDSWPLDLSDLLRFWFPQFSLLLSGIKAYCTTSTNPDRRRVRLIIGIDLHDIDRLITIALEKKIRLTLNKNGFFTLHWNGLDTMVYDSQHHTETESCPICLEEFIHKQQLCRISGKLGCRHLFHFDCISKWLSNNNTCPICRTNYRAAIFS